MSRPDSPVADAFIASPNHDARAGQDRADILLLHYTGMTSGQAALDRLRDPDAKVSSHYFVEEDGRVLQLVPEARRAWHAGQGSWHGRGDINSRSIGVEIVNPGHAHGYRPFPSRQIAAVVELCRDCVSRLSIRPELVLAHSDIAPSRKEDPGELFPWDQLFRAGVGLWVPAAQIGNDRGLTAGDEGPDIAAFQVALRRFGYDVPTDGKFDETTRLATVAFQRHHRCERVDGIADASTRRTLGALLHQLGSGAS